MKIPLLYSLSHYLLGFFAYYFRFILFIFIIYQLIQYIFNIRFFLLSKECLINIKNCVKKGNNLKHTLHKLGEFFIGYILSLIIKKLYINYKKF